MSVNLETSVVDTRQEKVEFSFQSQRRAMPKKCSNYHTIVFISHASKVMLKILQSRLQQYLNRELEDVQVEFSTLTASSFRKGHLESTHWKRS